MTRGVRNAEAPASAGERRVRVDKWLWAARFYRTRSLAAEAIEAGHVRVDGERIKPAHPVHPGARVSVRKRELAWEVEVLAVADHREGAPQAALLHRETAESVATRERLLAERAKSRESAATTRPTKRDRRKLEDFLDEP